MIVDHIPDLVALVDTDGSILYASPSHREVLGVDPDELVGEAAWERLPEAERHRSRADFAAALLGRPTQARTFSLVDGRGEPREMEGDGWQPILGANGEVTGILGISRDITRRLRAEDDRREMSSRIVAVGEEERRRIADEVHDAPIQMLTALGLRLETLRPKIADDEGRAALDRIEEAVGASIASLRSLMFELRPPILDREGLVPALRDYLARVEAQHRPGFDHEIVDRLTGEPAPEVRIVLYRIVQEAVVNVRRHAGASHVRVSVESVGSVGSAGTRVRVEDDGSGFAPEAEPSPGHIGLAAMRERAGYAGGTFSVGPRSGGGTVVEAWVPDR